MIRKYYALLVLFLFSTLPALATHISGGEIYYDCLGGNQYRITLVVYRDCAGINLANSYQLNLNSPCGNSTMTVSTPGGTEISQLCDIELPNSTCNGGSLPGIQQYIYTGVVTLAPCNSWTISWSEPWRNSAIANLVMPGNKNVYIQAVLNNSLASCNDSPQFTNAAIPYVCAGYPISYSYGAYDPDGDSLHYTLISAMNTGGVALPYQSGFSGTQPITGLTLDPVTGLVNFTLNQIGNWVVVVRVDQYNASGQLIGSVMRDMQFVSFPCSNIPPDPSTGTISNITGNVDQLGPREIEICESGDFCFDMVIDDPNVGDALTATSNIAQNLPGATFSYTGTNPITAHVCWHGQPSASGFFPFIVTATDDACPIPAFQTFVYSVHVRPGITVTGPVVTNESCAGNGSGGATVSVTAGTAPYDYAWSNGDSTATVSLVPGHYTVVVTDAHGCATVPLAADIAAGPPPNTADAGADIIGCFSSLPVNVSGTVTGTTTGTWSGGAGTFGGTGLNRTYMPTPAEIMNGAVDLYLTTTGNTGCPPDKDTVMVTLPTSFFHSYVLSQDALCNGGSTGSATYYPGDKSFIYTWSDPAAQHTQTAHNLSAGNYTLHLEDVYGCDTTLSTSVAAPAAITIASLNTTQEQCLGSNDGTVTASVSGGTAPYHYTWSNGDTTATITVGTGTYSVSVTDANGCTPATGSATISPIGLPNQANAGADLIGCFSSLPVAVSGTVTNATGGTWSGGNGTFAGTGLNDHYQPTSAEITAGGVDLYLTTTGNTTCPSDRDTVHVTLPTSFFTSSINGTSALCNAVANGSATYLPNDASFTYLWNDPAAQSTSTATGLLAGNYTLHVTDGFGCDTTVTASVGQPAAVSIASLAVVHEQCAGNHDGTITASITGGTAPYHYTWSNGDTTATITVGAGTYSVSVTDANGCAPATGSATVNALGQPNIANAGADLIGCFSALPVAINGAVTNATSGTWSGGNGSFTGSGLSQHYQPTPAEINAGGVDLYLTSTGNPTCPADMDTVHVTLPTSFFHSTITPTAVLCAGDNSGSALFLPNTAGFTYQWNDVNTQTTNQAIHLTSGLYSLHVTDAFACDTTLSVFVPEPLPLTISSIGTTAPTCSGYSNGNVALTVTGGTPVYTYAWSANTGGQQTATAVNLPAGAFTVTVTDSHGCHIQGAASLVAPPPVTLVAQVEDTVCVNVQVPLTAQAGGGSGGYVISWAGIGTGDTLAYSFPTSQTVSISVIDMAGCAGPVLQMPVTVLNLSTATLHTYGDTVMCAGGIAHVGAFLSGYPGSSTISWTELDTMGTGPFALPTTADRTLHITVADVCGQTLQAVIPIDIQTPPEIFLPPIIAEGCAPLTVHFPTGLTNDPVTYHWTLGDNTTSNSMAPVHTYQQGTFTVSLTVTTPIGCVGQATTTGQVIAHAPPVALFSVDPAETDMDNPLVHCTDHSTGNVTNYSWEFGDEHSSAQSDPSHTYGAPGNYVIHLSIEDAYGCTSDISHEVQVNPVYDVVVPTAFTPDPNGGGGGGFDPFALNNDVFYPFIKYVKDYRMRIFNRWGEEVFETTDMKIGWDGYYKGHISQQDVYVYQVWVRFIDDKEVQKMGDLTLFR